MLIGLISLLSAVIAAACCSFTSLHVLWQLPLIFVGAFLVLAALAFAFLVLMCQLVDLSAPAKDSPFYRRLMHLYIEAILPFMQIRFHTQGLEKTPTDTRFLLVCNHTHDADSPILLHLFRSSKLAFISKKENSSMFIVGKLMHMTLCQLINRENDREALKTILNCIQIIKDDRASIAVFPEGGIHDDRKLHHLKGGVFKIAQRANVPIVVCTLKNTQYIIPNAIRLKPTDVYLNLLDVIPAEEVKAHTTTDLAHHVYAMMAKDLGPERVAQED